MSTDNGIYIFKVPNGKFWVYHVVHTAAIDNLRDSLGHWDLEKIQQLIEKDEYYHHQKQAIEVAAKMYEQVTKDCGDVEYGIQIIPLTSPL